MTPSHLNCAIRRLVELGLKAHTPEPKAVKRLRKRVEPVQVSSRQRLSIS